MRNRIVTKIREVWSDLPLQNSWDEVLDEGITKGTTNWQLYGSRKPGNESYMLKHHYLLELDDQCDWCLDIQDVKKFDLKNNFPLLTAQYLQHKEYDMLDSMRDEYELVKNTKKNKPKNKLKIIDRNKSFDINDITNHDILNDAVERLNWKPTDKLKSYINEIKLRNNGL